MNFKLKPTFLKTAVSLIGSLFLVYLASAFFCSAPPCFTKKNEFLLTVFMSKHSWFFIGLWLLLFLGVYFGWGWWQKRRIEKYK